MLHQHILSSPVNISLKCTQGYTINSHLGFCWMRTTINCVLSFIYSTLKAYKAFFPPLAIVSNHHTFLTAFNETIMSNNASKTHLKVLITYHTGKLFALHMLFRTLFSLLTPRQLWVMHFQIMLNIKLPHFLKSKHYLPFQFT